MIFALLFSGLSVKLRFASDFFPSCFFFEFFFISDFSQGKPNIQCLKIFDLEVYNLVLLLAWNVSIMDAMWIRNCKSKWDKEWRSDCLIDRWLLVEIVHVAWTIGSMVVLSFHLHAYIHIPILILLLFATKHGSYKSFLFQIRRTATKCS